MRSYAFLFWGYLVVWIGLAGYLAILGGKMSGLARRIAELESRRRD